MRGTPLIVLFILLFGGWSEAQKLADIARKERARQQSVQTRIKITNDSVDYVRPAPSKAVKPTSQNEPTLIEKAPPAVQETPPLLPPASPVRDEKWWRTTFQQAQNNLKDAED